MKKCQVFTPDNYVSLLLNCVEYKENLYGKKILENSCGDGNILSKVIERYILDCKKQGFASTKISEGLENDIYGIEIIKSTWQKCINRLNRILQKEHIPCVKWKVYNANYFDWIPDVKFSYIIGNPPYITYSEINENERERIKKQFVSCSKGKFDYCYAFVEKSIIELDGKGKMSYLVPSSIFKTVFGNNLRNYILPYITNIIDFSSNNVFSNALVKSSVIIVQKGREEDSVIYNVHGKSKSINKKSLGGKWIFLQQKTKGNRRFGDYFQVSHAVATLYNKAFLLFDYKKTDKYIEIGNYRVEKELTRPAVSAKSLRYDTRPLIIFPYYYKEEAVQKYSEEDFINNFPEAVKYLSSFIKELNNRNSDKKTKWFEYGRSQALSSINQPKLLLSVIISDKVLVYESDKETVPFAGMFITKKNESSLNDAKEILESQNFFNYALSIGVHMSGSSIRIMSKDIMEYRF